MESVQKKISRAARTATAMGAAAATAAALTVGPVATASPPRELHPEVQLTTTSVYSSGPLFRLLDVLGVDPIGLLPEDIAAILATLGITDINNIPSDSVAVNNALNAQAFTEFRVPFIGTLLARTSTGIVLGIGQGSYATTRAYQALRSSAAGTTWDGYDALESSGVSVANQTNLLLVLLRNPSRPRGLLREAGSGRGTLWHR